MRDFSFYMPVKVISGRDCVLKSGEALSNFGKKALIITGKSGAVKSGALADVKQVLAQQDISHCVFDGVGENPLLSVCESAGKCAAEYGADFLIAIGGGSVLDAAKAAAIFATNRFENTEDIYSEKDLSAPLPLVLIGTTAGTGSEVSKVAVITVDATGEKRSITSDDCYAALALCDAKYTYTLPRSITVSTALDAFAHAAEGWFSKKRNTTAAIYARGCLPEIFGILKALASGKELSFSERDTMYYCSVAAGMVLCIGTVYPHLLGYTLTDKRAVPHGQACAVFDRHLITWCAEYAPEITGEFLSLLGADLQEVLTVLDTLIDIPDTVTFTAEEIEQFSQKWRDDNPKFTAVPGHFTQKEAVKLFEKFLKG